MSAIIGLAVASDELRALSLHDGEVRWALRAARDPARELSSQIADLLRLAPVSRWRRPGVIAAVGPGASQLKRLTGLPPVPNAKARDALVRESAGRFFLRNGIPLETSGVRCEGGDGAWAAAFERPLVREIERGCRAARFPLRGVVPAIAAIMLGVRDGAAEWRDGGIAAEVVVRGGQLVSVRRFEVDSASDALTPPVPLPITAMGPDGWRFADAYGAALTPRAEPLALRAPGHGVGEISGRRLRVASAALVAAVAFAIVAPALTSAIVARRAVRQLARLAPMARDAAAMELELGRMSRALSEVATFAVSRRSPTRLLDRLASALPEGAALVDVHVAGTHGTLVLLAPRAARAIAALDSVAGVAAPEVVGPVTREIVGARELERAAVRFTLTAEASP